MMRVDGLKAKSAVRQEEPMRAVRDARLWPHPSYPAGLWAVEFDDHSRIGVEVSRAGSSAEKTLNRIKSAAVRYSESHPHGMLSSVVVNLQGEKTNGSVTELTAEDDGFLRDCGISPE